MLISSGSRHFILLLNSNFSFNHSPRCFIKPIQNQKASCTINDFNLVSLQQTIYINDILHLHTVINNELWPRAPRENRKNMPRQLLQKTPASFLFCEKC